MAALHVNYRFVVDFCKRTSPGGRILDYGCGSGEIVRAGLAAGVDISGCETFYAGGHGVESAVQDLLGIRIFKMENGTIPFPPESFDCVVNNQVFEHVEDLDFVLSEIRRVLKRDGVLLSMFPSEDVVREGHCGVPLAHRFSKYPRFGYYWLLLGRLLGFGYHKKGMPTRQWARNFQHWLNHYCTYRSRHAIMVAFQRHWSSGAGDRRGIHSVSPASPVYSVDVAETGRHGSQVRQSPANSGFRACADSFI